MWLVAKHEYQKIVVKRSFLLSTLGMPLLIVLIMAISIAAAIGGRNNTPIGYVDNSGLLPAGISSEVSSGDQTVAMLAFPDEDSALAALESQEIQAYYVVPEDYAQNGHISLFYWEEAPRFTVERAFESFMKANLANEHPQEVAQRLVAGPQLTIRSLDGSREIGAQGFLTIAMPFAAGFLFIFSVMTSAGYLLQVVADEKENRTVELLVTSLNPEMLIGGKALGLMAVAFSQMLLWLVTVAAAILVGAQFTDLFQSFKMPWSLLLITAVYFVPAYALIAGLMTAIGGAVTELRHGQQIAGILNLVFILPYFFTALIFAAPNSPLMVALTLFPTTAFITVTLRWGMSQVPAWQLIASWLLLTGTAVISLWASARVFRAGMLRYGQGLDLRGALAALRS